MEIAESLVSKLKKRESESEGITQNKQKVAVLPYIHRLSHNLKKIAGRFGVPVVLTAPSKLSRLCPRVNNKSRKAEACTKKHANKYVECETAVVYEIPTSCGRTYIGQTGRCVNERAREHDLSVRRSPSGNLAVHCDRCPCSPALDETQILGRYKTRTEREIFEAFKIRVKGDACISTSSVLLSDKEFEFISREV